MKKYFRRKSPKENKFSKRSRRFKPKNKKKILKKIKKTRENLHFPEAHELNSNRTESNTKESSFAQSVKCKRNSYYNQVRTPWLTQKTIRSSGLSKLHNEIVDFYEHIRPKEEENLRRIQTIKLVKDLITNKWPNWTVKVFGSFPINLHLSNSDIDIVVFKDSTDQKHLLTTEVQQLKMIYNEFVNKKFVDRIEFVDARVPIVKAICKETGIKVDIS